jgi:hypothetical protein
VGGERFGEVFQAVAASLERGELRGERFDGLAFGQFVDRLVGELVEGRSEGVEGLDSDLGRRRHAFRAPVDGRATARLAWPPVGPNRVEVTDRLP